VDSVPAGLVEQWLDELRHVDEDKRKVQVIRMLEKYLDSGHGSQYLARPEIATLAEMALLRWHGQRYTLRAWAIMPNHVHVLVQPFEGISLPKLIQSWKKFTGRKANEILGVNGAFWFRDYFDRFMRDDEHYWRTVRYIEMNAVKAGLCEQPTDWVYSSARFRVESELVLADLEIGGPPE
jgi:REP element-mobilizing transposase RayT